MKKESISNVSIHCNKHAPKPDEKLGAKSPESFIGKYVKKGFLTGLENPGIEHMWVKVSQVKDGKLVGKLDNDPFFCAELRHGDTVVVATSEIEAVLD